MSQTDASDNVLPYREPDQNPYIGEMTKIVALGGHTERRNVTADGRCNFCGYDRGDYSTHTEVDVRTLECRGCEMMLDQWGREL